MFLARTSSRTVRVGVRTLTTYKFDLAKADLDTINQTLPAVAQAGTKFTDHFYGRLFKTHPELLNLFNQTNQNRGGQSKKLFNTVALAATAATTVGELHGEVIESIHHKHCALNITAEAYDIVGSHILGTIEDLLTKDPAVLGSWGAFYGQVAGVFTSREAELYDEMAKTPGGWLGKREFKLAAKEALSDTVMRLRFEPVDGGDIPQFRAGSYTTVWAKVDGFSEKHQQRYTEQPRHYTLAKARQDTLARRSISISVKRDGLVSSMLHDAELGSVHNLSAPYGCFDLHGAENLWVIDQTAPVVLMSAGVGITPTLAMLESMPPHRPVSWLHANINGSTHAYRARLQDIASFRDGAVQRRVWYSDPLPTDGNPGGNEENLAKYHFTGLMDLGKDVDSKLMHYSDKNTQYYLCGPLGWQESQIEFLMKQGITDQRIHYESF